MHCGVGQSSVIPVREVAKRADHAIFPDRYMIVSIKHGVAIDVGVPPDHQLVGLGWTTAKTYDAIIKAGSLFQSYITPLAGNGNMAQPDVTG